MMDALIPIDLAARAALERAANAGDTEAKLALAEQLLSYQPYDVFAGYKWASSAAQDGNAKAAHLLAVAIAEGLGAKQDFHAALDFLQRSAELGYHPAQRELLALAGQWQSAHNENPSLTAADCRKLCNAVDVLAWLKSPLPKAAPTPARIMAVESFAAPEVCDWLIAFAQPRLAR